MSREVVKRVLIIGLDGGTFDVLKPQMQAGNMPTLQRLVAEGAHGELRSTLPPITGPAWRTFASGCNPGKHGVIDFVEFDPQTREVHVKDVSRLSSPPAFWDELGRQGKRVGIMGVPMTYPPRPVHGFLLTGLMTPPGSDNFTFPADLGAALAARDLSFPTSEGEGANASRPAAYVEQVIGDMQRRVETASHLLKTRQPDCVSFVFGATDPLQHQFFHWLDPDDARQDEQMQALLGRFFRAVDDGIQQLLSFADDETLVIVISDHGFGRLRGFIHLNNWLLEKGYLRLRRDPLTRLRYVAHRLGYTPENIYRLAKRLGLDMRRRMNRGRVYSLTRLAFMSFANVDWSRTRAYALGHIGQVYIPRAAGMSDADYESLRDDLRRELLAMEHPVTGERIIERVYRREELYHGPYTDQAPDLILQPREFRYVAFGESEFASNLIVGPGLHTGHHRLEGILIMQGAGVQQGVALNDASIADIAPTTLYAMGLAVPRHMDGRPLQAAFTEPFVQNNPLRFTDQPSSYMDSAQDGYTEDEEELVRRRLRDLGYTA
jgi:predicted AlkP superfamily phosphohydrolase/phosphomutase